MENKTKAELAQWKTEHGICEMHIEEIMQGKGNDFTCLAADGHTYHQVSPNLWAWEDEATALAVYLGVGEETTSYVLRPLYGCIGGFWFNIVNGKPAGQFQGVLGIALGEEG